MGQKDNCPQANLIEIAAYAYDLGNEPFKNSSLIREFNTRLVVCIYTIETINISLTFLFSQVDQTYSLRIDFLDSSSLYSLFNATGGMDYSLFNRK